MKVQGPPRPYHRKLGALAAVFSDPAAAEHEKANAQRLKARLEDQLPQEPTPSEPTPGPAWVQRFSARAGSSKTTRRCPVGSHRHEAHELPKTSGASSIRAVVLALPFRNSPRPRSGRRCGGSIGASMSTVENRPLSLPARTDSLIVSVRRDPRYARCRGWLCPEQSRRIPIPRASAAPCGAAVAAADPGPWIKTRASHPTSSMQRSPPASSARSSHWSESGPWRMLSIGADLQNGRPLIAKECVSPTGDCASGLGTHARNEMLSLAWLTLFKNALDALELVCRRGASLATR